MSFKILLGVLTTLALAGCSGASRDDSEGTNEGALVGGWTKVLTCTEGNSRLVVDVDGGERRHMQVVVAGTAAGYFASQYNRSTTPIINFKGEVIGDGWLNHGIFQSQDLNDENVNVPYARLQVRREWGGVRVILYSDRIDTWCDTDTFEGECPSGSGHEAYRRDDMANWFFPSCSN